MQVPELPASFPATLTSRYTRIATDVTLLGLKKMQRHYLEDQWEFRFTKAGGMPLRYTYPCRQYSKDEAWTEFVALYKLSYKMDADV